MAPLALTLCPMAAPRCRPASKLRITFWTSTCHPGSCQTNSSTGSRRNSRCIGSGRCMRTASARRCCRAVVLIHGRTSPARWCSTCESTPQAVTLSSSVQEALARAGIDTFAPSLLGYGRSTRFEKASTIPATRASRRVGPTAPVHSPRGATAPWSRPSTRSTSRATNPTLLWVNPLGEQRRAHSSNFRFARTDVWVRDIDQVIDAAIERAQPTAARSPWWATRSAGSASGGRCTRATRSAGSTLKNATRSSIR